MGNTDGYPYFSSWKTIRTGKVAYDNRGNIIVNPSGLIPWFVLRSEILESGFRPNGINSEYEISGYTSKWFRENYAEVSKT